MATPPSLALGTRVLFGSLADNRRVIYEGVYIFGEQSEGHHVARVVVQGEEDTEVAEVIVEHLLVETELPPGATIARLRDTVNARLVAQQLLAGSAESTG